MPYDCHSLNESGDPIRRVLFNGDYVDGRVGSSFVSPIHRLSIILNAKCLIELSRPALQPR